MKTLAASILVSIFLIVIATFAPAHPSRVTAHRTVAVITYDTIRFYSVNISSRTKDGITTYEVNGKPATKAEYDKYQGAYEQMKNCKPCYIRTYSIDEQLLNEGDRYTDCCVGYWKQYYPGGGVKVEGSYKTDESGQWKEKKSDRWCSIRHGKWTYYSETGTVDSVVQYENDVRVKRITP